MMEPQALGRTPRKPMGVVMCRDRGRGESVTFFMPAGIITGLLGKVAVKVSKYGYKRLTEETPVSKAVERTSSAFDGIEVRQPLISWCDSPVFDTLLSAQRAGERNLTDDVVVDSFIQATGFYLGDADETSRVASEVITSFLKNVEEEVYNSAGGVGALASRGEVQHAEALEAIEQSNREIIGHFSRELSALEEQLVQSALSADGTERSREVSERLLHARVDEARAVFKDGEAKVAQSMLRRLREEHAGEPLSTELQFRIANTLGACALNLEDITTAREEFDRALALQPESHAALGNAAAAALLGGEFEKSLELSRRALAASPHEPQSASAHLQALHRLGQEEALKRFIEDNPWVADDPACCLALGLINCDHGDFKTAETFIHRSLAADEKNFHAHMLLSNAIFEPVSQELREDPPLPWRLSAETRRRIEAAERAATRAVEILENGDNRGQLHYALSNRAAIRAAQGRWDEAIDDCDRVLLENASHDLSLRHKGLVLLARGEHEEALRCFGRVGGEEHRTAVRYFEAVAHHNLGRASEAVALLEPLWRPDSGGRFQVFVAEVLAGAYIKLGRTRAAGEVLSTLRERWRDDTGAKLVLARRLTLDGKPGAAKELLLEALLRARTENQRETVLLELADLLFSLKGWAEAAKYYSGIITPEAELPKLQAYAASLLNAGMYPEALAFAREVRRDGEAIPIVTEVEANVLEYVDDLEPAIRLRQALSQVEPQNPSHLIRIFMLELRRGNEEEARAAISRLHYEEVKDNAWALIHMAEAHVLLGMDGALQLAYRARRLGFDNPKIHLAYMRVFLSREKESEALLSPTVVGVNCAVHVSRSGEKEVFVITDEQPADKRRDEIAPDDPLAQRLVGHRKGDSVVIRDTGLERLVWENGGSRS
jgi:tetratricopeptide (TPR) repeat protein